MYGLKYTIPFKTISEKDCVVNIEEKDYTGISHELIGGSTPFLMDIGTDDLLTPIRASSATLSVYGSSYLQDLYASDPQGIRITLLKNDTVKWFGYLTPDTFNQDFSSPEFIYEMECVCALSTLKYKEFDFTSDFVSFLEIIKKARDYAGYSDLFLTHSVRSSAGSFYDLKVSTGNFYDELGEAMSYYEILEEIAKYAGCVFTPYQDDLYLLDYGAIRAGFNKYERYTGDTKTLVTLIDHRVIAEYRGTGAKLSRIAGKNKAAVNCSLYEIKDIIPAFDDEGSSVYPWKPMEEFTEEIKEGKEWNTYKGIIRYFNQPKFTFYKYANGDPANIAEGDGAPTFGFAGSCFVKTAEFNLNNIPSRLSMTPEVQVRVYTDPELAEQGKNIANSPIIKICSERKVVIHKDVWFCLGLEVKQCSSVWKKKDDQSSFNSDHTTYQKAKFRVGEYYYTGAGWSKTESKFDMPIKIKKGEQLFFNYKSLDNTNTYDKGIGDLSGYTFKSPDFLISGDCELTIYALVQELFPSADGTEYLYYKNIRVDYGIPDSTSIYGDWIDKESKNDVVYERILGGEYVEEADDIQLKLCTNPDGKLALSSVIDGDKFLQSIKTDAFGSGMPEKILLKRVTQMFGAPRFVITPTIENHLLPYSTIKESSLQEKTFLFAGGSEDVKMESIEANLIEL